MRFSILALFGIVAYAAIAFASILNLESTWSMAIPTLSFALLLSAILALVYSEASERAFWFGFTLFGWGYFMTAFIPIGLPLITSLHLETGYYLAEEYMLAEDPTDVMGGREIAFHYVMHAFLTPIIGVFGGVIGKLLFWRRQKQRATLAEHSAKL